MKIFETVNAPLTQEKQYFSKDNMTLYTTKEVREEFGQHVVDILERNGEVTITTNPQTLIAKFQKNERTQRNRRKR